MAAVQPRIAAALKVADEVGTIVREHAVLDNEDVDGQQLHQKKPRPPKHPTNFPNFVLIQSDEPDLMSPARWRTESDETEARAIYTPPEHHQYLVDKDPEHGGRKWLTQEQMNPSARAAIAARVREEFSK